MDHSDYWKPHENPFDTYCVYRDLTDAAGDFVLHNVVIIIAIRIKIVIKLFSMIININI